MDISAKIVLVLLSVNVILTAVKKLLDVLHVAAPPALAPLLSVIGKALDMLSANPEHKDLTPKA